MAPRDPLANILRPLISRFPIRKRSLISGISFNKCITLRSAFLFPSRDRFPMRCNNSLDVRCGDDPFLKTKTNAMTLDDSAPNSNQQSYGIRKLRSDAQVDIFRKIVAMTEYPLYNSLTPVIVPIASRLVRTLLSVRRRRAV